MNLTCKSRWKPITWESRVKMMSKFFKKFLSFFSLNFAFLCWFLFFLFRMLIINKKIILIFHTWFSRCCSHVIFTCKSRENHVIFHTWFSRYCSINVRITCKFHVKITWVSRENHVDKICLCRVFGISPTKWISWNSMILISTGIKLIYTSSILYYKIFQWYVSLKDIVPK